MRGLRAAAGAVLCFIFTAAQAQLSGTAVSGPVQGPAAAQSPAKSQDQVDRESAGTAPADPGPLATDLSPALTQADIRKAMRKVADWQLRVAEPLFNRQWTFAALYDGLLAASSTTGDPRYREAVAQAAADKFHWGLIHSRFPHADDMAVGKTYIALDMLAPDPVKIADTRATLDRLLARPDDPGKNLWWWCDALYMAPPVLARMSRLTGDRRYLDFMDREWSLTTAELYDPQQHLFSRDASYLKKTEANGQKLFWARGNGWVLAGLVQVLSVMPADYPGRARYEQQFREIANRVAGLQQPDGLWRTGLLDQQAYTEPEVSGTAFYAYAMAWGINTGRLPRARFLPVVTRAWAGMLAHIYADGRLGDIQKIGAAPDVVGASSSYVYGVGGFLLAGAELDRLANATHTAKRP
jgi:unsaturated rhamnogalacturonyl hydrolase